jgi:hypothetical protein
LANNKLLKFFISWKRNNTWVLHGFTMGFSMGFTWFAMGLLIFTKGFYYGFYHLHHRLNRSSGSPLREMLEFGRNVQEEVGWASGRDIWEFSAKGIK